MKLVWNPLYTNLHHAMYHVSFLSNCCDVMKGMVKASQTVRVIRWEVFIVMRTVNA